MDANLSTQLALAALVCSVAALFFSLVAAFPGLKLLLALIRDAVLWVALVLVLGGLGYVLWQERRSASATANPDRPPLQAAAGPEAPFAASELAPRPLRPRTLLPQGIPAEP
jgi:hypothetical protein